MTLITSDTSLIEASLIAPEARALDAYLTINEPGTDEYLAPRNILYRPLRGQCAKDRDIVRHILLPFDFDPVRPTGTAATLDQVGYAVEMREALVSYLSGRGWPCPAGDVFSGNGRHTYFRTDLPNTPEVRAQLCALYDGLARKFDRPGVVKLDKSVRSPAQIMRMPGTFNHKAQRMCEILSVSENAAHVTLDHIRDVITDLRAKVGKRPLVARTGSWTPERMEALLNFHGLDYLASREIPQGTMWILCPCPFNDAHVLTSSMVMVTKSGFPKFKCKHDSCQRRSWNQFLAYVNLENRKVFSWTLHQLDSKLSSS